MQYIFHKRAVKAHVCEQLSKIKWGKATSLIKKLALTKQKKSSKHLKRCSALPHKKN